MIRPLTLPVDPTDQKEFNRRVATTVNAIIGQMLPEGLAFAYEGTAAPKGWTETAGPGTLGTGWIWITK